MSEAGAHLEPAGALVGDKGLKRDAIGYLSNLVIGVASTAPAYSLAATLGFIVAVRRDGPPRPGGTPRVVRPGSAIAFGYKYLNRADPDCGTTFAWSTRAMGPWARLDQRLDDFRRRRDRDGVVGRDRVDVHVPAVRRHLGRKLDACDPHWLGGVDRIDDLDLLARDRALRPNPAIPARGGDRRARGLRDHGDCQGLRNNPAGSLHIGADWFNPFSLGFKPLVDGVLFGILH